mmetsp:Transcript_3975/g.9060  ORF Transcript_3975/g.9060 Transcript_3975/m.9060 type:complete len:363 (+) Transcript_3975:1163-2251(+)
MRGSSPQRSPTQPPPRVGQLQRFWQHGSDYCDTFVLMCHVRSRLGRERRGLKTWERRIRVFAFVRDEQGYIRTSIGVVSEGGLPFLEVKVADTGIGIEPDQRKNLFAAFSQLQDFAGGTGLGLYSVLKKVNVLGGACGVDSNTPKGSIFWFRIPYVPTTALDGSDSLESLGKAESSGKGEWHNSADLTFSSYSHHGGEANEGPATRVPSGVSGPEPPTTQGEKAGKVKGKSGIILLIEDDVSTRKLMTKGLEKQGYTVVQAGNGVEGLEKLQEQRFNMVLCDIMMPVMDGVECTRRFRQWEKQQSSRSGGAQYICALSANTEASDVAKTRDVGMDDFFPKPVKIQELLSHLDGKFLPATLVP